MPNQNEDFIEGYSYCPNCERVTIHRFMEDDEIFELGLECMNCHIIFEAETDEPRINDSK